MDFPRYNQWSPWTIEPIESGKKPFELKSGDRIKVDMKGMVMKPIVLVGLVSSSSFTYVRTGSVILSRCLGKHDRSLPMGSIILRAHKWEAYVLFLPEQEESRRYLVHPDRGSSRSLGPPAPSMVEFDAKESG